MNVLLTTDCAGGVWTYTLELARALAAREVAVTLAVLGGPLSAEQRREAAALDGVDVHCSDYALEWMPDPWDDLERAAAWLLELATATDADLVHLNQFAFGSLAWDRPVVLVAHSDVMTWFAAVRGVPAPEPWRRYRQTIASGIEGADVLVAPTRAMLDALEREYEPHPRTRVIPNGRRVRRVDVPKEPLVLAAGRLWDEAKNAEAVFRVAPRLPCPVAFAGGVGRADLDRWLSRAPVFASPARYEPFGLTALEAAQCGCALVLGDIPSQREVWGDAALYVEPDDDEALERALLRLLGDDALRERQAGAAEAVARALTPERMGASYLALYAEVADRAAVLR